MVTVAPEKQPTRDLKPLVDLKYDVIVDLYRRKARALEVQASRRKSNDDILTFYVLELLGPNLTGSIACALDPFWQFAKLDTKAESQLKKLGVFYPSKIVSANRLRRFLTVPYSLITHKRDWWTTTIASGLVSIPGGWAVGPPNKSVNHELTSWDMSSQEAIYGFTRDTTVNSRRPDGQKSTNNKKSTVLVNKHAQEFPFGEFELWKPKFYTNGFSYYRKDFIATTYQAQAVTGPKGEILQTVGTSISEKQGYFVSKDASVDRAAVNSMALTEQSYALAQMAKRATTLVSRCVPGRRYYNAIYQVAELRDLPHTLKSTMLLWVQLEKELGRGVFLKLITNPSSWNKVYADIVRKYSHGLGLGLKADLVLSDQYLNFKFGWQSMIQALNQLADAPGRISKDINLLIKQHGKSVTLRTKMSWSEPLTSTPSITIYQHPDVFDDSALPPSSQGIREVTLKCVCNSGVNFPTMDVPKLRRKIYLQKIGLEFSPADIYDLIPWSWMVDWFLGSGDYLHAMEAINADKHLINYGFITYVSKLIITARRSSYIQEQSRLTFIPPNIDDNRTFRRDISRSARFEAKYQLRKSVSSVANIKLTDGTGLNQYQKSIVGALFSKYLR